MLIQLLWCRLCNTQYLGLSHIPQSSDSRSDSGSSSGRHGVSTTGNGLLTRGTGPHTGSTSPHGLLTAERAVVTGMLLDFQLLDLSSQGRTVTHTVLTSDTDLLCSLSPEKSILLVQYSNGWRCWIWDGHHRHTFSRLSCCVLVGQVSSLNNILYKIHRSAETVLANEVEKLLVRRCVGASRVVRHPTPEALALVLLFRRGK